MIRTVRKRDGTPVWFDAEKLNKWAEWAGNLGVDWSTVVLEATRKCNDGCSTVDLHKALIAACIDQETEEHLFMAGRLYVGALYKDIAGKSLELPKFFEFYQKMVKLGYWQEMDYSEEEFNLVDSIIQHQRDFKNTITRSKQIIDKYACKDLVSGVVYETPQIVYMRMALGNMQNMPKDRRMKDVAELYNLLSQGKINPPSPFSLNLGTPRKQYASCCVATAGDTLNSLAAADHVAYIMTAAAAGIGMHLITRSFGDSIRQGTIRHQGKIPYYKVQERSVLANVQASRGGANTMHFTVLDPEYFELVKLKNVQTIADKRVKDIDYSVCYNTEFARRVALGLDWMLVSLTDAPFLWKLFFSDRIDDFHVEFERIMASDIPKKIVKARDVAVAFLTEAVGTGRIFDANIEEMNRHTPFLEPIYLSNLCQEIALPTKPFEGAWNLYSEEDGENRVGEIGLCNIAAIPAHLSDEEFEKAAYYTLLMIDNVIDIMEYPFPHLKATAQARRSVGVGITNLAYTMAKNGMRYSTKEGKKFIAKLAERHSYFLHKAAIQLTKERGTTKWPTKYNMGWLPIDTANKEISLKLGLTTHYDWDKIRDEIVSLGGLHFSVLESHMPCESSSSASGHTNGLYPIRAGKVVKTSGSNKNLFIAPEFDTLGDAYELAWDIETVDLIDTYAIVQQWTGQSTSADEYIKYSSDERKVSSKKLLQDWLYRVKMGVKTRYYINSATGVDEEVCEACKL